EKTLDSWNDSSKNLWRLINSGMSLNSKVGLGFEIQSNNEILSYEEEMNFSVFNCSKEDSVGKPLYSRFTKTNDFQGVPHPLSGDYTPIPQEEIDESLYVYGKKGPQEAEHNVSDDRSSEYSTCQSNDSAESIGTSSEHFVDPESKILSVPLEVYVSTPITSNEKGMSDPKSKEVEPSCVSHIKAPRQPIKDQAIPNVNRKNWNAMMERELGEGYSFTKKKCFFCDSLSHLIKDCDYYEQKMARKVEVKKQRVFNTGNGMAKPVWTNANRVNHANKLVPRPVQLNIGRPNINSVRTNINTGRTNINSVRPRVNTVNTNVNTVRFKQSVHTRTSNSFSPKRPQVNPFNQRRHFSKSYSSVKRPFAKTTAQMSHFHVVNGNWGSAIKTSAGYNWRNSNPNSNYDSGPTFIRTVNDHPLKNMVDRGIFDSGCSGHMTGNKDQLEDFEEFNGGYVTFGGSKGYISNRDYGGSNLDKKSTIGGCQFLGQRLISWQCKKQTIVATSTTEAEYVVAANCCGQVLWVQNQLVDYGFNFMNTKIHIDNESTICIVKNPVYHSKTKHIEIRHHFIRDCYEKKLIRVEKIHTDLNVADLLTKSFDGPRFNYLVASIEIVDFLRRSNLRYALTTNPTIYDSLVKQFWQTATANTLADGTLELHTTIDTIVYTITEASIRNKLQLADASGITMLPNNEIFEGMGAYGVSY
ncbi:hypothetical protein Tco_0146253, partial [Tanacetum coccineum]